MIQIIPDLRGPRNILPSRLMFAAQCGHLPKEQAMAIKIGAFTLSGWPAHSKRFEYFKALKNNHFNSVRLGNVCGNC